MRYTCILLTAIAAVAIAAFTPRAHASTPATLTHCAPLDSIGGDAAIQRGIGQLLAQYPKAQLKDIYKSFFQDVFGPGHLISDAQSPMNYLREELAAGVANTDPDTVPTGYRSRFVRVNLMLVADSVVPPHVLAQALYESAARTDTLSVAEWTQEWHRVLGVAERMGLDKTLPNYDEDAAEIEERLAAGKYAGHHSDAYNDAYNPHYRIVATDIFNERIAPLLAK